MWEEEEEDGGGRETKVTEDWLLRPDCSLTHCSLAGKEGSLKHLRNGSVANG